MKSRNRFALGLCVALLWGASAAYAQSDPQPDLEDLSIAQLSSLDVELYNLSVTELLELEVTTVSKKPQRIADVAAAVYIISQEDIRRSGATTIPEALRLAPGVNVGRVNSNTWAVSIRGFNESYANKLLVLMDGRSLYSPLYAGTFWDVQDTAIEDIERIEVVRGPGGTIWGANAVNGVINIITKKAKDTQGTLVSFGGGNIEQGFATVRQGGTIGESGHYRVYGKFFNRDSYDTLEGDDAEDDWYQGRGGFRMDFSPSDVTAVTVQGDIYGGKSGNTITFAESFDPPYFTTSDRATDVAGGNILARIDHQLKESSRLTFQTYYDRTHRDRPDFREDRDLIDAELRHELDFNDIHSLIWGVGLRVNNDQFKDTFAIGLDPKNETELLSSAFVQDEISLLDDRLLLTLGSKFEYHETTGVEIQPSVRALYALNPRNSIWGAVSRAVRTPSRVEEDLRYIPAVIPTEDGPPAVITTFGSDDFDSEELIALELGYRTQVSERLVIDLAAYYNIYDELRVVEQGEPGFNPGPPPRIVIPTFFDNRMHGETYGGEIVVRGTPVDGVRLEASYSLFLADMKLSPGSTAEGETEDIEDDTPRHQAHIRGNFELTKTLEFDALAYYNDRLSQQDIDAYVRLDLRLGWSPTKNLQLSLVGTDLLDGEHREYEPIGGLPNTRVERSFYGKVTYRF